MKVKLTKDQLRSAKKKIREHLQLRHSLSNGEVAATLELLLTKRGTSEYDKFMQGLARVISSGDHPIDLNTIEIT